MRSLLALVPLLAALAAAPLRQDGGVPPPTVPELEAVVDLAGKPARLAEARDAAVLLFFHAGSSRYSSQGLEELVARLAQVSELRTRARLWVLCASADEARAAEPAVATLGDAARVLVDASRGSFAAHGVVAAPTLLCVSPERRALARVQGYGALFAFRGELGARFAAGLLEREAYERALAGTGESTAAADPGEERQRLLIGKLVAAGSLTEAEALLPAARTRFARAAWPVALAARCALERGRGPEAQALLVELERVHPEAAETAYLRARLMEAAGETEAACRAYRAALERKLFE